MYGPSSSPSHDAGYRPHWMTISTKSSWIMNSLELLSAPRAASHCWVVLPFLETTVTTHTAHTNDPMRLLVCLEDYIVVRKGSYAVDCVALYTSRKNSAVLNPACKSLLCVSVGRKPSKLLFLEGFDDGYVHHWNQTIISKVVEAQRTIA